MNIDVKRFSVAVALITIVALPARGDAQSQTGWGNLQIHGSWMSPASLAGGEDLVVDGILLDRGLSFGIDDGVGIGAGLDFWFGGGRMVGLSLEVTGLADLFEVVVDGVVAEREGLAGKPAPDMFLAAARALGVVPAEAAVFEDSLAGVEAGRAGGFGFVVGVDRTGQADELLRRGADIVVSDLWDLAVMAGAADL